MFSMNRQYTNAVEFVFCALFIFVLSACGGSKSPDASDDEAVIVGEGEVDTGSDTSFDNEADNDNSNEDAGAGGDNQDSDQENSQEDNQSNDSIPTASDDSVNLPQGGSLVGFNVLANDSGLDDAPITLAIVGSTSHGTLNLLANNRFDYIPAPDFFGEDTFVYRLTDEDGDSDTATVTIFVMQEDSSGQTPLLEGYGTDSSFGGGPDSEICVVTNLNDSGEGSFRDCVVNRNGPITNPTPRTINFAVGGTITLLSDLSVRQPYLTINGLEAPAPGITLDKTGSGRDGGLAVNTWPAQGTCGHDVLIEGIRFEGVWEGESEAHDQGAGTLGIDGEDLTLCIENVVFNRVTVIHAQDAGGDMWGSVRDVTVQYSAFLDSLHPNTYSHWPGGETNQERQRISNHHNLYAYIHERGVQMRAKVLDLNFEQNIIHRWAAFGFGGGYGTRIRCRQAFCPERINLLENHWTSAGSRLDSALILGESAGADTDQSVIAPQVYMSGNRLPAANVDVGTASTVFSRPSIANVTLYSDQQLLTEVLPNIGVPYRTQEESDIFAEVHAQIAEELEF